MQSPTNNHPAALLEMDLHAMLLPELQQLPFWGRAVHEILMELNPGLINELEAKGQLKAYLEEQDAELSERARKLEREWKLKNPLPAPAQMQESAQRNRDAQAYAREVLREQLSQDLMRTVAP